MLAVGNDRQFESFCVAAGGPKLAMDRRFKTNADRVTNRGLLIPEIAKLCRKKTTAAWLKLLAKARVPCGPINNLAEVFDEPQVRHRKLRFDVEHGAGAKLPQVRQPALFGRSSSTSTVPPPRLGADTAQVLSDELGLTSDEILSLTSDATIG